MHNSESRRDFLKTSATAAAASLAMSHGVHGASSRAGSDPIRVGLVGCGGRGTGAAGNALEADPRVQIVAMADVFQDRINGAVHNLTKEAKDKPGRVNVPKEMQFVGFEAYKKVLEQDLDYVILATPPYFRSFQLLDAVKAGKHVFFEKPVAVDPPGCRRVMEAGKIAEEKGLSLVAGTQRRHQGSYVDTYEQVRKGALGDILSANIYWLQNQLWFRKPEENKSDMENMLRDWVNWRWLSGDHIVEQHMHNIDVANWFLSKDGTAAHPIKATGMGGRAHRVTGDQWDFFGVDFEYPNGVHVASYCRQINGCANNVSELIVGTEGHTWAGSGRIEGKNAWSRPSQKGKGSKREQPYVQEHVDLIASIRGEKEGKKLNEAHTIAVSTLTAILGREASYSGNTITWDDIMKSNLNLAPAEVIDWNTKYPEIKIPVQGTA